MRPINLIPPEERHGERAPLRSGPLPYVVVGALVAILAGVTALVLTGNEIAGYESEIAVLESEDAAVAEKAERLAAYTQFQGLSERRVATVAALADSRFDWERVMRELALILPGNVWMTSLTASSSSGSEGGGSGLRGESQGPALELNGCATGQKAVAGFVTALEDIDGVTRVGVQSSDLAEAPSGGAAVVETAGSASDGGCGSGASFEMIAVFDAAPVPAEGSGSTEAAPVAAPDPATGETSTETSEGE